MTGGSRRGNLHFIHIPEIVSKRRLHLRIRRSWWPGRHGWRCEEDQVGAEPKAKPAWSGSRRLLMPISLSVDDIQRCNTIEYDCRCMCVSIYYYIYMIHKPIQYVDIYIYTHDMCIPDLWLIMFFDPNNENKGSRTDICEEIWNSKGKPDQRRHISRIYSVFFEEFAIYIQIKGISRIYISRIYSGYLCSVQFQSVPDTSISRNSLKNHRSGPDFWLELFPRFLDHWKQCQWINSARICHAPTSSRYMAMDQYLWKYHF